MQRLSTDNLAKPPGLASDQDPDADSGSQSVISAIGRELALPDRYRGRNTGYPIPPAQIRAGAIYALGSHLG